MVSTFPTAHSDRLSQIRWDIRTLHPQLVEWRRHLHQFPELGFQERMTAEFIAQKLREWEIDHQMGIAKTGIVATIAGKKAGRVLAIRADMDALPVQEENEVDYRSRHEGIMHACGHDGHTAIALGTALYLSRHREDFNGTVKIIFQPAEESPGGAKPMIEAGALKNPDAEAIVGLHLWNSLPWGTIGVRSGALMAASELFSCTILGKGGHGAIPQETIDAIAIGAQIVTVLQTIVARNVSPLESAVVTVGEFHAGTAKNAIADTARLTGTVRYFNTDLADFLPQRIEEIIAGVCQSHRATYDFNYTRLYPPTINDAQMTDLVRSVAFAVLETPAGVVPECQTMASEDMSYFLQEVPGCYFFLGSANPAKGLAYPHHHPRFNFDESVLCLGVEMFIRCVEKFCN
ncbi:MAG: amidohydrolase [Cyanobacteria bacterium SBLK]|nr:amidohydrolase [Cyanobacteria bacterium SBLK]